MALDAPEPDDVTRAWMEQDADEYADAWYAGWRMKDPQAGSLLQQDQTQKKARLGL